MCGVIPAHLHAYIEHNDNFLLLPFNTTDCYGKTFRGGGELYNYKKFMFQLTWANEGNTIWQAPNKAQSGQLEVAGKRRGKHPWRLSGIIQNGSATHDILAGVRNGSWSCKWTSRHELRVTWRGLCARVRFCVEKWVFICARKSCFSGVRHGLQY